MGFFLNFILKGFFCQFKFPEYYWKVSIGKKIIKLCWNCTPFHPRDQPFRPQVTPSLSLPEPVTSPFQESISVPHCCQTSVQLPMLVHKLLQKCYYTVAQHFCIAWQSTSGCCFHPWRQYLKKLSTGMTAKKFLVWVAPCPPVDAVAL